MPSYSSGPGLCIDIETLPAVHWSEDERRDYVVSKVPGNYKKPESRDKWVEANAEEVFRKTALDWRHLNLYCVCLAYNNGEVLPWKGIDANGEFTTKGLLNHLGRYMKGAEMNFYTRWIGHNIATFDVPILFRLAVKYEAWDLAELVPCQKWSKQISDTMLRWQGSDWKGYASLSDICSFLGLGSKTEGLDGSKVYDYYLEGRHDEVLDYCAQDVELTRKLDLALRRAGK